MVFYLESSNFFGTLKRKCCLVWVCPSINSTKTNNYFMLLRLIFTLSIFLPTLAVYAHELSHHEHKECEGTVVHFHQKEDHCYLDDFVFNNTFIVQNQEVKLLSPSSLVTYSSYKALYNNSDLHFRFLRGPPTA